MGEWKMGHAEGGPSQGHEARCRAEFFMVGSASRLIQILGAVGVLERGVVRGFLSFGGVGEWKMGHAGGRALPERGALPRG